MDTSAKKDCAGLPDSHLHTKYSFDSELEPESHARDAVRLGLRAITITDHADLVTGDMTEYIGTEGGGWDDASVIASAEDARSLRGRFPEIDIYAGIELGQAIFDRPEAERVLSLTEFDFVLGSMHLMSNGIDYYYIDFTLSENDPYDIYAEYLDNIYSLVLWNKFDCLAHLTYPLRLIVGKYRIDFNERRFDGMYDRILKVLADSGKALEINTSGARRENGFMLPDAYLVGRFREFGGKYITLGSDAHRSGHFAAGLREGADLAKQAGFGSVAVYKEHRPEFIPI